MNQFPAEEKHWIKREITNALGPGADPGKLIGIK